MSTEYSDRKIKEIMAKVNGQAKLAEQAVMALIQRDPQFLQSLVTPYLNGIVSHGIERARKSTGIKEPAVAPQPLPKKVLAPRPQLKPVAGNTMDNLMKALAKGFEEDAPKEASGNKVSQNHIDALKAMIKPKKY